MMVLLLNLLQSQQRGISRVVIVGAVLAFIAGVSLLVYFYRRYKRIEKEPEEDWNLSRRSLFVNVPPPAAKTEETSPSVITEAGASLSEEVPVQAGGTRELASGIEPAAALSVTPPPPEPRVETAPPQEPMSPATEALNSAGDAVLQAPNQHPSELKEPRPTQVLASPPPKQPITTTTEEHDPAPFDEEVWAGLESVDQPFVAQEESHPPGPLESATEPPHVARVDERPHLASFEPPSIKRITRREDYEPPRIQPLTPREQATRDLRSARPPQIDQTREDPGQGRSARETGVFGSSPRVSEGATPVEPRRVEIGTSELAAEPSLSKPKRITEPSIAGGYAHKAQSGSILGLPAEASNQPLVYGDPVPRPDSESGIGALSNYGKDIGPKGGRGGTIALLLVVVLLGGGVLLYLFVPSVHSRVTTFVAHMRGTDIQAAQEAAMKQRAQIIPSFRPEVNKNLVTARGAVDNISDEPLENLSIEVSLQRGDDAAPEIRSVSVVPNPLPPGQRGTFEFEYDGKRDTGFTGYKIIRLLSNGTEVRFRMPGQK
jgi:hypothetical protein